MTKPSPPGARDADLEQVRAERSLYRTMARSSGSVLAVRAIFAWSVLFPSVAIGVWGIAALFEGDPEDLRQAPIAFTVAFGWVVAVAAVGAAILYVRSRVPAALRARTHALAAQYGGVVSEDRIEAILDWLDAHWPAAASAELMARTSSSDKRWALSLVHRGRPVLIVVLLTAFRTRGSIHVLLPKRGAGSGGAGGPSPRSSGLDARGLGFSPGRSAAGIHLKHFGADTECLEPSAVARALEVAIELDARAPDAAITAAESENALDDLIAGGLFTRADLEANREARISKSQRRRLMVHALLGAIGGASSLAYGIYVLSDLRIDDRAFGFVLLVAVGVGLLVFAGFRARSAMSMVAELDGPAVPEQNRGHRGGTFYTVSVGEVRFAITERFYRQLVAGVQYRFYHVVGTRTLLSVEPLPPPSIAE